MARSNYYSDYEAVRNPRFSERDAAEDFIRPTQPVELEQSPKSTEANPNPNVTPRLKPGHFLSYLGIFLFSVMLYFRPYELFPALSFLSTSAFWIAIATLAVFLPTQLGLEGSLTWRPREVNLVLLLTLAALIGMPFAISPLDAWNTFNESFVKAVIIFVVMINAVRTEARLRSLIYLSLGVGFVLSVSAVRDYQLGVLSVEGYRAQGLIGNLFGNPNDLAIHLVMMLPIAIALLLETRSLIKKVLLTIGTLLIVIATVVTYSRGGFLGMVAVAFVLAWKLGRKNRASVMMISVIALIAVLFLAPGAYGIRMLSIFFHNLDPLASASSRQDILVRSGWVALRHPVLGIGMGNFHIVSIHELVNHNSYMQVATEMGLPAMLIYIIFMITPLKRLRALERATFEDRKRLRVHYLAIGLQASIVGYMVTSFFGSVAYLWYVYYLAAYAICLHRIYATKHGLATELLEGRRPPKTEGSPTRQLGALADRRAQEQLGLKPAG